MIRGPLDTGLLSENRVEVQRSRAGSGTRPKTYFGSRNFAILLRIALIALPVGNRLPSSAMSRASTSLARGSERAHRIAAIFKDAREAPQHRWQLQPHQHSHLDLDFQGEQSHFSSSSSPSPRPPTAASSSPGSAPQSWQDPPSP